MVIVALLFIALAVVFAVLVLTGSDPSLTLDLRAFKVDTSLTGVYLSGILTVLVAGIGLWMLRAGLRRSRNRRSEVKQLRRAARTDRRATPDSSGSGTTPADPNADGHFNSAPRDEG
jgi:membrane protein implicated in regulation of membrane protease activity